MKNFKKSAFSLIELSIVLLIIGILIAGVTQSSRLIRQMKLTSARSLTESSPVASIKGLSLWLETTGEKAFSQELEDGAVLTGVKWLDRNPQSSFKADAETPTSLTAPTYVDNCINDLPCLSFISANSNAMDVTQGLGNPEGISVYIILKLPAVSPTTNNVILNTNNTDSIGNGWHQLNIDYPGYTNWYTYIAYDQLGNRFQEETNYIVKNSPQIIQMIQGINGRISAVSNNGVMEGTSNSTDIMERPNLNNGLNIGYHNNTDYFEGFISEIIIFDRALKNEERISVQNYLAKKWGIKI